MSRALTQLIPTSSRILRSPSWRSSLPIAASRALLPVAQARQSSHSPLGAAPAQIRKPVTINTLQSLYRKNEPVTMMTAHDFPSAHVADHAGMDMILVGDSLAMVALGMEDTSEVLMEEMLLHCRSVARATKVAFTVRNYPDILPQRPFTKLLLRLATSPWAPMKSLPSRPLSPLSA